MNKTPENELAVLLQTPLVQGHIRRLAQIMDETINEWRGCGSYMIDGQSTEYRDDFYHKQELIWRYARQIAPGRRVLEIGVHGGHSLLLILLANPQVTITAVDICIWGHTVKCVEYLQSAFPEASIELLQCRGEDALPTFRAGSFELVHIDANHEYGPVYKEAQGVLALDPKFIIFDDYDTSVSSVIRDLNIAPFEISNHPHRNCVVCRPTPPATPSAR